MHAGHKLALALGVVDSTAVTGDDELSRKQLIRAGEEMVRAGLAIVVNKAGTKQPICTLTSVERKRADQEAKDEAAAAGDPNAHKRTHPCGLVHAITDVATATRVLTRMSKRERFNLGVEARASRVVIVDVDTAAQAADFALRCGADRPTLTVKSPGQRDSAGNWVHSNGGHIWFEVPDGVEMPTGEGVYTADRGWTAIWGEHQVLVPPSARAEGPYVLVGSLHPMPQWLAEVIADETAARQARREEARQRRSEAGPTAIDEWSASTSWDEILTADGWTKTGLVKNCGCPQWTAPGEHASPESATAHEPGCATFILERGHGPLHVWTDNPSEAVSAAISAFGSRTLTKAQVITYTEGGGQMGRTLDELGVERPDGPTTLSTPFTQWSEAAESAEGQQERAERAEDGTEEEDDEEEDPAAQESSNLVDAATFLERMVKKSYERMLWDRLAQERMEAEDAPPLRVLGALEFLNAPRPESLVPDMLYRDSLSRMYGAPGCGKSFLSLDLSLSLATGSFWCGTKLDRSPVIYVMAEGQRVNGDRTEAWLSKNSKSPEDLDGWLFVVPDALKLTEAAIGDFVKASIDLQPALVVLDTKNAMMEGEENSASDFARMRRALDAIRKASGCCVLLVDHTGYEGTRARGSSAGTAGMDTEIRVLKDDDERPALITAEITRDKASESGTTWAWRLVPEHPAAVLSREEVVAPPVAAAAPEWTQVDVHVPERVRGYTGQGKKSIVDLARLMALQTSMENDPSRIGVTLTEARRELLAISHERTSVFRAWSALKDMGYLACAITDPTDTQEASGRHLWAGPTGLVQPSGGAGS